MEEEEESSNDIVESRKELMISSAGEENPTLRVAHFLKPSVTNNLEESCNLSSLSPPSWPTFDPKKGPLTVKFHGWRYPQKKWNEWVKKMKHLHEPTWKKAGIREAILNSTYQIHRNNDLVLGIAERWCPDTKSFIFPWGEASITLEDMMISGYSVLGCPVFEPLETEELMSIQERLIQARREVVKSPCKKADQSHWLKKFMDSGSEVEHEAFLSLWLSRFVLPTSLDVISQCLFPIAVHLAIGTRIALAPAVLAEIYRDLSLLKGKIVALTTLPVILFSPFQLVQVWVWERFIKLRPKLNLIKGGEPRLAQWNNLKCEFENLWLVLDSSKESFIWRPYTKAVKNWDFPKFYREKEMWVSKNSGLDEELESFIRCLRVSELVGIEADCIEQYLPHRVARQFGIDQDVPDFVGRSCRNREDAWSCYNRPIGDVKCYIPSRLCETDVTSQYMEWWRHSVMEMQSASESVLKQQKTPLKKKKKQRKTSACLSKKPKLLKEQHKSHNSISSFNMRRKLHEGKQEVNNSKRLNVLTNYFKKISSFTITPKVSNVTKEGEMLSSSVKVTPKSAKEKECERSSILKRKNRDDASVALHCFRKKPNTMAESSRKKNKENDNSASKSEKFLAEINNLLVPPGFSQKCNRIEAGDSSDNEDNLTIAQLVKSKNKLNVENRQCGNGKNLDDKLQSCSFSFANEEALNDKLQRCSSSFANEEATRTSVLATLVEQVPRSEKAVENGQGGQNKSASGQHVVHSSSTDTIVDLTLEEDLKLNEAGVEDGQSGNGKNASDPYVVRSSPSDNNEANLTSMESLMFNEAAETQQDHECGQLSHSLSHSSSTADNEALEVLNPESLMENVKPDAAAEKTQVTDGENAQYQSRSSSVADSEPPKTLEEQAISAQNVSSQRSRAHKLDSACGIKEGTSNNAFFDPLVLKLENEISRLEKIVAEFKAEQSRRN